MNASVNNLGIEFVIMFVLVGIFDLYPSCPLARLVPLPSGYVIKGDRSVYMETL